VRGGVQRGRGKNGMGVWADARGWGGRFTESGKKYDQVFVSTSYFLGVEKMVALTHLFHEGVTFCLVVVT
jgi:hypothetical protein